MSFSSQIEGDLPPLTLTNEELLHRIISFFAEKPNHYYSFTSFIKSLSENIIKDRIGFNARANTSYIGDLCQFDQARVREIIWDMIIERHLTIGGAGHHNWPNFSVTERGKVYFAKKIKE